MSVAVLPPLTPFRSDSFEFDWLNRPMPARYKCREGIGKPLRDCTFDFLKLLLYLQIIPGLSRISHAATAGYHYIEFPPFDYFGRFDSVRKMVPATK